MSMAPKVNVLEYSGRDAGRWGPLFFKPSLRTSVLALLAIAATTWLALRHEPWRRVNTFPISDGEITLTPGGNLLSFSRIEANLYDATTGRLINSVPLNAT